ncbi:hypothetical protein [Pseudomonas sp. W5-01]|uniref:hypothetical protein n=1 Tax=Pseudomonas sp. W5-01 TaxID=3097454 RepID=UPI003979CD3C
MITSYYSDVSMETNDLRSSVLERARQQIEQIALAGDREVMLHSAAHAHGWVAALQAEDLVAKEQYEMLRVELESAISMWNGGPQ